MMNKEKAENLGQDRISLMIVEDNEYMLDILVNSLKRMGFTRIQKARNGKEAVEPIDVVISDLIMTPVNGVHLLQWLRDDKQSPNRFMPFIMLSGAADRVNVEETRDRGVTDFMAKPFSVDNIYKVLQRIIDVPRSFVTTQNYFGPDRRRSNKAAHPSQVNGGVRTNPMPRSCTRRIASSKPRRRATSGSSSCPTISSSRWVRAVGRSCCPRTCSRMPKPA